MSTVYRWHNGRWEDKRTGRPMEAPEGIFRPAVLSDIEYKSPLSMTQITSRSQRREEMKRFNVREVAPEEYTPVYRNKKYAEAVRGEWDPNAGTPDRKDDAPFVRLTKDELPEKLRKSIA